MTFLATPWPTLLSSQKPPNHRLLFVLLDAREELGAELVDGLGTVEGELVVHLAAGEVTGLAALFEDGTDVACEIDFPRRGRGRRRCFGHARGHDQPECEADFQHAINVAPRRGEV